MGLPLEQLRSSERRPYRVWTMVEWYGHWTEGVPVRIEDERWLIAELGEAT